MPTLTLEATLHQHPVQIAAEADGEVPMVHMELANDLGLNALASVIRHQRKTPCTIAGLCEALLAEFDVKPEPEHCQTETLEDLQGMVVDGLAEVVSAGLSVQTPADQATAQGT